MMIHLTFPMGTKMRDLRISLIGDVASIVANGVHPQTNIRPMAWMFIALLGQLDHDIGTIEAMFDYEYNVTYSHENRPEVVGGVVWSDVSKIASFLRWDSNDEVS